MTPCHLNFFSSKYVLLRSKPFPPPISIKKPITRKCLKNINFNENTDPYQSSIIKTNNFEKIIKKTLYV